MSLGHELALKALKAELKKKKRKYNLAKELSDAAERAPIDLIDLHVEAKTIATSARAAPLKSVLFDDMKSKEDHLRYLIGKDAVKLYDAENKAEREFKALMHVVTQFERMFCHDIESGAE